MTPVRGRLHVQLPLCSGNDAANARHRRRLFGTTQIGKAANHLVRMSGPVQLSTPDHEHRHRHNRGDERDQRRQRDRRDDDDHNEDRQRRDDEQSGDGDRGELGDTDRCDGCDAGL